jgi:hypothetical protein
LASKALHLGALASLRLGEFVLAHAGPGNDLLVEHQRVVFAERAHRQLGLEGHPQLAHHDHIQRCAQRYLEGDRDPAPGQPEHHDVRTLIAPQPLGQLAPGIHPINEHHCGTSLSWRTTLRRRPQAR